MFDMLAEIPSGQIDRIENVLIKNTERKDVQGRQHLFIILDEYIKNDCLMSMKNDETFKISSRIR